MPDQLDAQIRALVREIVGSAPPTPSFDLSAGATLSVDRHRMSPRMRVIAAVAACVVVALVIAGVVLIPQSDRSSVRSPAPTGCSGKAYVNNQGDNTRVGDHPGDRCRVGADRRRSESRRAGGHS